MKSKYLFFIWIAIISALSSCEKEQQDSKKKVLSSLSLNDAKSLLISSSQSNLKSSVDENDTPRLFKITDEGVIIEVTAKDENGNDITEEIEPAAIYNVNSDYFIIVLLTSTIDNDPSTNNYQSYLVSKTDGNVYLIGDEYPCYPTGPDSPPSEKEYLIQTDNNGNIYFRSFLGISIINIQNLSNISLTNVDDPTENIKYFFVNPDGYIAYGTKIRFNNGGYYYVQNTPLYSGLGDGPTILLHFNGDFLNISDHIYLISCENNTATESLFDSISLPGIGNFKLLQDKTVTITGQNQSDLYIIDSKVSHYDLLNQFGIKLLNNLQIHQDNLYAIARTATMQPVFVKITFNGNTLNVTNLTNPNEYDIYNYSICNDGAIYFDALNMTNGNKILGLISPEGILSILDEIQFEVKTLIQIQ